jgi:hypothetical protein
MGATYSYYVIKIQLLSAYPSTDNKIFPGGGFVSQQRIAAATKNADYEIGLIAGQNQTREFSSAPCRGGTGGDYR